jgi:hypothetical protein
MVMKNTRQVYFNDTLLGEFSSSLLASLAAAEVAKTLGFRGIHSEHTYYYTNDNHDHIYSPEEDEEEE